jgi:hypothetical protein
MKKKNNEPTKGGYGVGVFDLMGMASAESERREDGGERGEICWSKKEEASVWGFGLRVKWYFYCTVQP